MKSVLVSLSLLVLIISLRLCCAKTYLRANGAVSNAYEHINSVLGGEACEVPDCAHPEFGRHIRQGNDGTLNKEVFFFYAHTSPDDDRCINFDRQRVEIKTYGPSPDSLKGYKGDDVTLSWNFKLDAGFQPSSAFTHIHQLKAVDGDDSLPLITLTPRYKAAGNEMELIHVDSRSQTVKVKTVPLAPFLGQWVHVKENVHYDTVGKYQVDVTLLSNGQSLLSYSNSNIDMWRDATSFIRPKWGIYRSLTDSARLRDEVIRFDEFCLGKGSEIC